MSYVAKRADRLHAVCSNVRADQSFPLFIGHRLTEHQFATLLTHANIYLYESLNALVPGAYDLRPDFLEFYQDKIAALPSITPNGLLLPKKHSFLAFNMLFQCIVGIIRGFGLSDVSKIHFPINVRIINGRPDAAVDARPRSSVKLHSDIWAGEFANHITAMFPIAGDMEQNGVELYEPGPSFYPQFVRPLADFDDGREVADDATKYDVVMQPGSAYFLDSFLLHRTMKKMPGLRLMISFTFLTESHIESDLVVATDRHGAYIDRDRWLGYGSDRLLVTMQSARSYAVAEAGMVQNRYADDFDTVELK